MASSDLFKPFAISDDVSVMKKLLTYISSQESIPWLELSGYSYSASSGYIIDDSGFLPTVTKAKPLPKKIVLNKDSVSSERDVSAHELSEVHHTAKLAIDAGYQNAIQSDIIKTVQEVEESLPVNHSSFGVVRDKRSGKIVGSLRAYQGFISADHKLILPSFEILRKRDLLSDRDESQLMKNLGSGLYNGQLKAIIEVGQFYIDSTLTLQERIEVRRQLWIWFTATHLNDPASHKMVIAHVSKEVLARKYKVEYGFDQNIVEKTFQTDQMQITEKVLMVSSDKMKSKLLTMINLNPKKLQCSSIFAL